MNPLIENCELAGNVVIGSYTRLKFVKAGLYSKIWHYCNIYGTREELIIIGNNTQIGSYSEIKPGVVLGDNCRLQSHIFIPEGITLEDFVFVGPRATFLNDKYPTAQSAINKNWKLLHTTVKKDVVIGGGATIGPGVVIGTGSIIGMGSVVTKDIPNYAVVCGNPARIICDARDERFSKKFKRNLEGKLE